METLSDNVKVVGKINLDFKNIPSTGFSSTSEDYSENRVTLKQKYSATIKLSPFSLAQLLQGAEIDSANGSEPHWDEKLNGIITGESNQTEIQRILNPIKLYFRLRHLPHIDEECQDDHIGHFTRDEVKILKHWLELRMSHCEKERDDRNPAFNPDTYIAQKLLLIELREWLLGEVIE